MQGRSSSSFLLAVGLVPTNINDWHLPQAILLLHLKRSHRCCTLAAHMGAGSA